MKKYTSVLLTVVLLMSLAAGCGTSGSDEEIAGTAGTEADAAQSSAADTSAGPETPETPEAKEFNIYSSACYVACLHGCAGIQGCA